jgi:hypothetical protein
MTRTIRVGPPSRLRTEAGERVAFHVDEFEVQFTVRTHALPDELPGEVALAAALLPAMRHAADLELDSSWGLTEATHAGLQALQARYATWGPELGTTLRPIRVTARHREAVPRRGVLSFFSGGVDGLYTALENTAVIDALVMLRGIDMQLDNEALWAEARAATDQMARYLGKPVVEVTTNIRYLCYHHGFKWALQFQAAGLASIAHLLAPDRMLVAASTTQSDPHPFGSHPLLDPLWSSGDMQLVCDGAVARTEKLRTIVAHPEPLARLRVCWQDAGFNCGRCEKCIRTMAGLTLLGAPTPSFLVPFSWAMLGRLEQSDPMHRDYLRELADLERQRPAPAARRILRPLLMKRALKDGLRSLDAALLGGVLRRLRAR